MHGSCNPSRLDGGDCDLFVANPVEECPRRARCRTGQYATRRWRIGGVEDTEVTGAGHKRMPPRDGRHVPPISGCDLLPLRDIVEDAAQVGADTGEGDDIALGNLRLLPQMRGPPQRELDLEGKAHYDTRDVRGFESFRRVLRILLREDEVLEVPRLGDLGKPGPSGCRAPSADRSRTSLKWASGTSVMAIPSCSPL